MTKGTKVKTTVWVIGLFLVVAILYRYNPYRVSFLGHYDKIWAHRVNDQKKLLSAAKYFEGIELDLVYLEGKNILDVNHPPAPSNGLTLEAYLSAIEEGSFPFLWLDIKNLDAQNNTQIFDKLQSIFSARKYPLDKVLIETRYPEALPRFSEAGYITSYYLPVNPSEKTPMIASVLQSQPNIGISTSYKNYEAISEAFPKKSKYIWILNHSKINEHRLVRTILKDTTVKVVLVPYRPF